MLTFQAEPMAAVWNEFIELAYQHWKSTKSYRRHQPFNPLFERYRQVNEIGFYTFFTARDHTRLAGYCGIYLSPSMHSQWLIATEDILYLHPDYRVGRNALRFMQYVETELQKRGVREGLFSCEIDNESGIKRLLEHLDYRPVIMMYSKLFNSPAADSGVSSTMEEPADVLS